MNVVLNYNHLIIGNAAASVETKLRQINLCTFTAICQNNGTNSDFIINIPSFNIKQLLDQKNKCSGINSTCANVGLNNISLVNKSPSNISILTAFDIDQMLAQLNQCTIGSNCLNDGINQIFAGTASNSSISNVKAEISQRLNQENNCKSNATCANKFTSNDVSIGTTEFGGERHVSNIDSRVNQNLNQINQCSNNTEIGVEFSNFNGCDIFASNQFSIGDASFGGNSSVSNVDANINQKLSEINNCSNGTECIAENGNFISIGSTFLGNSNVNNVKADINQQLSGLSLCNDINPLFGLCLNSGSNLVSLGDSAFVNSSLTNIDADINQKITHTNECTINAGCDNEVSNQIIMGPASVSNIKLHADQISSEDNNCTIGMQCANRPAIIPRQAILGQNSIVIGSPFFGGNIAVSGVDANIRQKTCKH